MFKDLVSIATYSSWHQCNLPTTHFYFSSFRTQLKCDYPYRDVVWFPSGYAFLRYNQPIKLMNLWIYFVVSDRNFYTKRSIFSRFFLLFIPIICQRPFPSTSTFRIKNFSFQNHVRLIAFLLYVFPNCNIIPTMRIFDTFNTGQNWAFKDWTATLQN